MQSVRCRHLIFEENKHAGLLSPLPGEAKFERQKTATANPFIDAEGYRDYVSQKELIFEKRLKELQPR